MSILRERFYWQWKQREMGKGGTSIDILELPVRVENRLRFVTIDTVEELCEYTPEDLEGIKSLSKVGVREIMQALKKQERTLKNLNS